MDVVTRWTSQWMLTNRLLVKGKESKQDCFDFVKQEVMTTAKNTSNVYAAAKRFTPTTKHILKTIKKLLQNLASMSTFLEGEKYVTISAVIPLWLSERERLT